MGNFEVTVNLKMGCRMMPGIGKRVLSHLLLPEARATAHSSMWIADHSMLILPLVLVTEVR